MNEDIFRQDAVRHHLPHEVDADALLRLPRWTSISYGIVVCSGLAVLALVAAATMPGPIEARAVVGQGPLVRVSASSAGIVAEIPVAAGAKVASGDALIQMLVSGRTETVDASKAGRIEHIYVHAGQSVASGESLVSIEQEPAEIRVFAVLSAPQRGQLSSGQSVTIDFEGPYFRRRTLTFERIDDDGLVPEEIRWLLLPTGTNPAGDGAELVGLRLRGASTPSAESGPYEQTGRWTRVTVRIGSVLQAIVADLIGGSRTPGADGHQVAEH